MGTSKEVDAFKIYLDMMSPIGVWPIKHPKLTYSLKTATCWFILLGVCSTMVMEVVNDFNNFEKFSQILYIFITWATTLVKLSTLLNHKELFWEILDFSENPLFISDQDHLKQYMVKSVRISTIVTKILRVSYMTCACLYSIVPFLDNTPTPFPFPYDMGRYTFIMFIFQSCGELLCAWICCCLDTLCWAAMSFAIAQLKTLTDKIENFDRELELDQECIEISDAEDKKILTYFHQCIEHHLAIMKFIDLIERVFTIGLLAQFITSVITVCNTLFYFVLIPISFQFALLGVYIVCMFEQLFLYCWLGNEIMLESLKVGRACYMSKWNKCGYKIGKCLFIIMERSKRPLKITTLKFSTLSLSAFASILNWSYSCFALLLKMYSKKSSSKFQE